MCDLLLKIDKTLRHHAQRAQRTLRTQWRNLRRPPADRPVIVLGCSRAGTTVVYTLSESPELGTLQSPTADNATLIHCLPLSGTYADGL